MSLGSLLGGHPSLEAQSNDVGPHLSPKPDVPSGAVGPMLQHSVCLQKAARRERQLIPCENQVAMPTLHATVLSQHHKVHDLPDIQQPEALLLILLASLLHESTLHPCCPPLKMVTVLCAHTYRGSVHAHKPPSHRHAQVRDTTGDTDLCKAEGDCGRENGNIFFCLCILPMSQNCFRCTRTCFA